MALSGLVGLVFGGLVILQPGEDAPACADQTGRDPAALTAAARTRRVNALPEQDL